MNILQLISSGGFFGAENVLLELSKALKRRNVETVVGVFNNKYNPHTEVAEEAERHNLKTAAFQCNGRFDPRTLITLRSFLKHNRIDLIHTHNYKSNFYAFFASLGLNLPLVTTCHNWLGASAKMRFYNALDKSLLSGFDRLVAVSDRVKDEIMLHGIPMSKVSIISNGIDITRFASRWQDDRAKIRKDIGVPIDSELIGTVGRLTEEKGHSFLLEAARIVRQHYPKAMFIIIGDGPLMEKLKKEAGKLPFIFTGFRNDMPGLYSALDLFVLPSLNEGLPMVLLEAMASHKPVVATKVGDVPKLICSGQNGLLVEPANVKSLADALLYLSADDKKRCLIAQEGYRTVLKHFSSKVMADRYLKIYREVSDK